MHKKPETTLDLIAEEIRRNGPLPFSRYMEICLYDRTFGYYSQSGPRTGKEGDYYTSPHVHELFGTTVSRWLQKELDGLGIDKPTLLELGPGNGQLAEDVINDWKKEGKPQPELILVEESLPSRELLAGRFAKEPVTIYSPDEWDSLPGFSGAVIANEFFDALPLRLLERQEGCLCEVYVDLAGGSLTELLIPVNNSDLEPDILKMAMDLPPGHRTAFAPGWRSWLDRVSDKLVLGVLLVIDYGDVFEALNVPWRKEGTLRCFKKHEVVSDPFIEPGQMDITAHVNFTLIMDWARKSGFLVDRLQTQSSFLIRAGILNILAMRDVAQDQDPAGAGEWLAVKNLIHDEAGMGEVFKVLALKKGITDDKN